MRCTACNWTAVSFDLESRTWRCKRCHSTVADTGGPGFAVDKPPTKRAVRSEKKAPVARPAPASRGKRVAANKAAAARPKAKTKAQSPARKSARKKSR